MDEAQFACVKKQFFKFSSAEKTCSQVRHGLSHVRTHKLKPTPKMEKKQCKAAKCLNVTCMCQDLYTLYSTMHLQIS